MSETSNLSLEQRAMQGAAMTPEERKRMWLSISDITEAQFDALQAKQKARQVRVPQPGTTAPDFELDRVTSTRTPTGALSRRSVSSSAPTPDRRFVTGPCA